MIKFLEENKIKIKRWGFKAFIVICAIASMLFVYKLFGKASTPSGEVLVANTPSVVQDVPTIVVSRPKVRVYDKKRVAEEVKVQAGIVEDNTKDILAIKEIPPSEGGYIATAVLNNSNGITDLHLVEKPQKLFGFGGKTEVGGRVGLSSKGGFAVTGFVRQDLLRVNNFYTSGYGEVTGTLVNNIVEDAAAKVMVDVSYRW